MQKDSPKYNFQRKNRAGTRAALRAVVCLYLLYLARQVSTGFLREGNWIGVLIGGVFALVATVFGIFTWKSYRSDLKAAELTEEELAKLTEEDEEP